MPAEQPRTLSFAPDFRVGAWLVQPSLDRLSRGSSVVHLRPQLTDLLVLLARNAGRTVSKGQILATVWGRLHVAESGLSRCVAELRRALEDDAREPKVLETITKRGYRLVAPVVFLDEENVNDRASAGHGEDAQPEPDPLLEDTNGRVDAAAMGALSPVTIAPAAREDRVRAWLAGAGLVLLLALTWFATAWNAVP